MFRLEWNWHDGSYAFQDFDSLEDASYVGQRLRHFYDGVEIVDAQTGEPLELL